MAAASTVPQAAPLSEGARIVNTFFSPTKTFTDINRKASWFVPWLLLALMPIAVGFTVGQKVGWPQVMENQLRIQPKRAEAMEKQMASMTPAQREKMQKATSAVNAGFVYGWGIVRLLGYVIIAAILMFSFNFGAGAQVQFSKALAVVVYASLPELIRGGLAITFLYSGILQPDQYLMQNPVGSNLGALLTPGTALWTM